MKRTSFVLAIIALAAVATAFTSSKKRQTITVGKLSATVYVVVDPALKGNSEVPGGWDCFNGSDTCLYSPVAGASAPYTRDELIPDISAHSLNKICIMYPPPAR